MEDMSDADYTHAKSVCKDFEIKSLGKYHDLYVQSAASLLPDVLNKLRNMCLEVYQIDPNSFFTALGLAWEAALKKTKVK